MIGPARFRYASPIVTPGMMRAPLWISTNPSDHNEPMAEEHPRLG